MPAQSITNYNQMDNNDFFKDKRKRAAAGEKMEKRQDKPRFSDKPRRDDAPRKPFSGSKERRTDAPRKPFSGGQERRSYNPNFTPDNKLREGGEDKPRFSDKPRYGEGKPRFTDRPRRDGEKPKFGESKPRFSDRPRRDGEKPRFGDKPKFGDDKPRKFGAKPGGKPAGKSKPTRVHGENADGSYPTFAPPTPAGEVRLNRHIAASGRCSRRDADLLIRDGHVKVNGEVVTEMGYKVAPADVVELDGKAVGSEKKVYILMNKPKGFVTTLEDPHADKTVIDLLGDNVRERVYPVGRLDKNSLGVLLLTNDGDLTSRLTHPSYNKKKIYQATLDRALTHADMQQITDGLTLEDGPVYVDAIDYASENRKDVGLEIHSGRNRIVRRIFEHLGYKVTKLDRVYFAGLTKRNLKRGQWRFLTPMEVDLLRNGMYE